MQAPAAGGSSAAAAAPQGTAAAQPQPVIPGVAPAHAGAPLAGDPMAAALAAAQQFLGFMSHAGVNPGGFPPGPAPGLFAPPGAPQGPARPGSAAAMFSPDHHQMRPGEGPASRGATPGVGGEMAGATYNRKDKRCAALSAHHHRVVAPARRVRPAPTPSPRANFSRGSTGDAAASQPALVSPKLAFKMRSKLPTRTRPLVAHRRHRNRPD